MKHFAITQRGAFHIAEDTVCQDYSASRSITLAGQPAVLAAVSDGVGSCLYSDEGSRLSVITVLDTLENSLPALETISEETVLPALKAAFDAAYIALSAHADEEEKPLLEFDCTLTVTLFLADGRVFFGHVGDDGAVVMYEDGSCEMITRRHKGDCSNSVFPLLCREMWSFGATQKPVASLAMMTDGVLDVAVGSEVYENRVYLPMLRNALVYPMQDDEHAKTLQEFWEGYLQGDSFRETVTDDITLLVVQRPEAVAALPEVTFDQEAWDAIAARERERVEAILLKSREEWLRQKEEERAREEAQKVQMADPSAAAGVDPAAPQKSSDAEGAPEASSAGEAEASAPSGAEKVKQPSQPEKPVNKRQVPALATPRTTPGQTVYGQNLMEAGAKIIEGICAMTRDVAEAVRFACAEPEPAYEVPAPVPCRPRYSGMGSAVYTPGQLLMVTEYGAFFEAEGRNDLMLLCLEDEVFGAPGSRTSREALAKRIGALCRNTGEAYVGKNCAFAWPCDVLHADGRGMVGCVLQRPGEHLEPLDALWKENGPGERYGRYDLRARLAVAYWVADLVRALHLQEKYVFDFQAANFALRKRGMISYLRMDHLSFTDRDAGVVYKPVSGVPEMMPPEVICAMRSKSATPCNRQTDAFSLALLIHMILCDGRHPFDVDGYSDTLDNICSGRSVFTDSRPETLPDEVCALFTEAFGYSRDDATADETISRRPSADKWTKTLRMVYQQLGGPEKTT